jgi:hypothetical protein
VTAPPIPAVALGRSGVPGTPKIESEDAEAPRVPSNSPFPSSTSELEYNVMSSSLPPQSWNWRRDKEPDFRFAWKIDRNLGADCSLQNYCFTTNVAQKRSGCLLLLEELFASSWLSLQLDSPMTSDTGLEDSLERVQAVWHSL